MYVTSKSSVTWLEQALWSNFRPNNVAHPVLSCFPSCVCFRFILSLFVVCENFYSTVLKNGDSGGVISLVSTLIYVRKCANKLN